MRLSDYVDFDSVGLDRKKVNGSLTSPRNTFLDSVLGMPRKYFDQTCRPPTNPHIISQIVRENVGPFEVTGLYPVVAEIGNIFARVKRDNNTLYDALGSAGMLCCRYVRGSENYVSNHAWGIAIDIKIDDILDVVGDNLVQRGLLELSPYFIGSGFCWGAAFPTEDSMHFEASEELITDWVNTGKLRQTTSSDTRTAAAYT